MDPQVIPIDEVPMEDLREILGSLLKKLGYKIVRERTPDYTAYELMTTAEAFANPKIRTY